MAIRNSASEMDSIDLPHSPGVLVLDRFDLLDSDSDMVPFWSVLKVCLSQRVSCIEDLIEIIETLSVTLHERPRTPNYELFRRVFDDSFIRIWPTLRSLALDLPNLLPAQLCPLNKGNPPIKFSRRQVSCLVMHQFLCTLSKPFWMTDGSQDFSIWYGTPSPHEGAVEAYLWALRKYLELVPPEPASPITFELREQDVPPHDRVFAALDIVTSSEETESLLGLPHGAGVISANKDVGFGRTASQEEMVVGSSPELCSVVFMAPTMSDGETIVVQGAQAMISITGYARTAKLERYICDLSLDWSTRTVLFMDALELDAFDASAVPDLLPGNVERELKKAYTAFSAHKRDGTPFDTIVTGLWGCRSFGGNKYIKTVIQWAAASLAGVNLRFVCTDDAMFTTQLEGFVSMTLQLGWTVSQVMQALLDMKPEDWKLNAAFDSISFNMQPSGRGTSGIAKPPA